MPKAQQAFDLRQFPSAEQTDRVGAVTLPVAEFTFAAVRALATLAMQQAIAVDTEAQAPAFDIDVHLAGLRLFGKEYQTPNFQRGVAQLLVNLAVGQGGHRVLRWNRGVAQDRVCACRCQRVAVRYSTGLQEDVSAGCELMPERLVTDDLEQDMKNAAALTLALALTAGLSGAQARAAGDAEAGATLFKRICGGCHQVGESARGSFGPQLNGIFGRPSGSSTDYQYSDAMKSAGIVWTRETLTAYLENPKEVVPGTRMIFWGLSDPEKIENLLAYLQTFQPQ